MKIGIDASLVVGEKAGVGWCTANLIEALARVDHHNQYSLYPFFYHIFDPLFKELAAPEKRQKLFCPIQSSSRGLDSPSVV